MASKMVSVLEHKNIYISVLVTLFSVLEHAEDSSLVLLVGFSEDRSLILIETDGIDVQ